MITGADAPDFAYASIDGEPVRLSDFRGDKVVLVNVWATWCGPCVVEMPSMQRLYDSLDGEDFEILAVSVDAPAGQLDFAGRPGGDLREFTEELELTFPILHDPDGEIQRCTRRRGCPRASSSARTG